MDNECIFFRINTEKEKGFGLKSAIQANANGLSSSLIFTINPTYFSKVPGSPFAYWVSEKIRDLFVNYPVFSDKGHTAKGLSTSDDFRFIRLWWEINPSKLLIGTKGTKQDDFIYQTYNLKKWVPCTKGGDYSPYYADILLVINWEKNGEEIKKWVVENPSDPGTTHWSRNIRAPELYFKPGLSWTHRTTSPIGFRILNAGCVIGVKGPAAFYPDILSFLGLMQTNIFRFLFNMRLGAASAAARSYDISLLLKTPVPITLDNYDDILLTSVKKIFDLKRDLDKNNENSHLFIRPISIHSELTTLTECLTIWLRKKKSFEKSILEEQQRIDNVGYKVYNIEESDRYLIEESLEDRPSPLNLIDIDGLSLTGSLLSYLIGGLFGRWDIRFATGEKQPPELPDPFAPLPANSPGMLQGEDGLPLSETPLGYPLKIDDDGILVDDEYHPEDIITQLREVLTLLWGEKADSIEQETCEILGVKSLREYFRKPGSGGFWDSHLKRYSKSRRKAPIYWLLQSSKKNYALWIYYHRLTPDTLFRALERYVKPKIQMEENRLAEMQSELKNAGTGGATVKRLEKAIEKQELFVGELSDFKGKLERAASLFLEPDLDDGVVLTIAPLHELVPWKEADAYWNELLEGKYEWSSIGIQLRKKGMVKE